MKWYNQFTDVIQKNKGVKQGCPISPRLFIFLLAEVLDTVYEQYPHLYLEQLDVIRLPLLLAYADDIIIATRDLSSIEPMLAELLKVLKSVGLEVNNEKSTILIRDPHQVIPPTVTVPLAGITFKVVQTMRYLGSYLTSALERPLTIRTRCHQALGIARRLKNFIKENKVPFPLVVKIYETIIVPMIIYGLKTTALTRANRRRIRSYELLILNILVEYSTQKPATRSVRGILKGRTITKRIQNHFLRYWGHIKHRPEQHILQSALRYTAGPKKVGRPCFTWYDALRSILRTSDKTTQEWEAILINKNQLSAEASVLYLSDTDDTESDSEIYIVETDNMSV